MTMLQTDHENTEPAWVCHCLIMNNIELNFEIFLNSMVLIFDMKTG